MGKIKRNTKRHLHAIRLREEQERKEEAEFQKRLARKLRDTRIDNMLKGTKDAA